MIINTIDVMSPFSFSFSYETVKYVKVEDSRLGCLRLVLLLGILLYVGVVEMAYMGGYLEATRVVGAVRFSLQHPEHGSDCQSTLCGEQYLTKAMATEDNCTNDFAPLDTLAYCEQSHHQQAHQVSVMNDENTMDTRFW